MGNRRLRVGGFPSFLPSEQTPISLRDLLIAMSSSLNRRAFTGTLLSGSLATKLITHANDNPVPPQMTGPMVGHTSTDSAVIWCRPERPGTYRLTVTEAESGRAVTVAKADAIEDRDFCVTWLVTGLRPETRYRYVIASDVGSILASDDQIFQTAPNNESRTRVRLAFGSCADTEPLPLWSGIDDANVDGLVLLGDTPYIDSRDLTVARDKHRAFLRVPELARLIRHTSVWGTWDDHDFGGNDTDGRMPGKANTRRAFVEYRANREYGADGNGIYTRFRRGPVEVFLLDTRWFARTAPSPVDPTRPTLLGTKQWRWLLAGLKASTAPFKIIACGMIWDDKENRESDDWGTYAYERSALFDFLGRERISGVLLIGGDIHCSRLLKYDTMEQVGYPIHQMIVSPIHKRVIPSLNVDHPDLVHGAAMPHVWLRVEVDRTGEVPRLTAEWIQMEGRPMWSLSVTVTDLTPKG